MRAGPSTVDLESGLSVGVEVSVYRAGRVLAASVPVDGVKLEWSSGRVVPAQVTYSAPLSWTPSDPLSPLNRFGQRSIVTAIYRSPAGREWRVDLGEYLHTDWQVDADSVQVTALDLMQVLESDPMAWPSSPPRGATVRSELQRLAGTLPVVLDEGVRDAAVPVTSQWGCSRSEAVTKLADSMGFGLRCGADGCLHAYPIRDARAQDVVYTSGGLLLDCPPAPEGDGRRPNRWIVTGTSSEGQTETKWTATRTAVQEPFDVDGYGWVTSHREFSAAGSQSAVEQAADTYMAADLHAVRSRSLEVVPDARIEVGDVIGVVTDEESFAGRVTAYSLPLSDVGASMRVDVDVLEW